MVGVLLPAFIILSCLPSALLDFAVPKWAADKTVRIEDAYKWIFQATRGGEHAAPDREMAQEWLGKEWALLDPPEHNERLWDPLCGDDSIGRLNLRVFKSKGGQMPDVVEAFLASSRAYRETGTAFLDTWQQLGDRLKKRPLSSISYTDWLRLDDEMRRQEYPAIHHSKEYDAARHPAYRIMTAAAFKRLKAGLTSAGSSVRPVPSPRP